MNLYERAFDDGERASYRDRMRGKNRLPPIGELSPYASAWWDGYKSRSAVWKNPTRQWWMEKETEASS